MNNDKTPLQSLQEITSVQCSDGNWNHGSYMHGMANGMILSVATIEGKEPKYLDAPSEWLNNKEATGKILVEISNERIRQDKKWGGPEHDDKHSQLDFAHLISQRTESMRVTAYMHQFEATREKLIQIASLAVAAIESLDRKEKNND